MLYLHPSQTQFTYCAKLVKCQSKMSVTDVEPKSVSKHQYHIILKMDGKNSKAFFGACSSDGPSMDSHRLHFMFESEPTHYWKLTTSPPKRIPFYTLSFLSCRKCQSHSTALRQIKFRQRSGRNNNTLRLKMR